MQLGELLVDALYLWRASAATGTDTGDTALRNKQCQLTCTSLVCSLVARRGKREGQRADPAEELADERVDPENGQGAAGGESREEVAVTPQMRGGAPNRKSLVGSARNKSRQKASGTLICTL